MAFDIVFGYIIITIVVAIMVGDSYYACIKTKSILKHFPFWENTKNYKKWFWSWTSVHLLAYILFTLYIIFNVNINNVMYYIAAMKIASFYNMVIVTIIRLCIANYIKKKHDK